MRKFSWVLLLTLLTGCSTTRFADIELPTTAQYVIATPAAANLPSLVILFDLVGTIPFIDLVKAGRDLDVRERLDAALEAEGLNVADEMHGQLEREFAELQVDTGKLSAVRRPLGFFKLFAKPDELPRGLPLQSFVDLGVFYGFIASVTGADYKPYLIANLQVVAADTHAVTYRKSFLYNFSTFNRLDIKVQPATTLASWKNAAAIEADIPGASAAFRIAMSDVAKKIVEQLQADLSLAP